MGTALKASQRERARLVGQGMPNIRPADPATRRFVHLSDCVVAGPLNLALGGLAARGGGEVTRQVPPVVRCLE